MIALNSTTPTGCPMVWLHSTAPPQRDVPWCGCRQQHHPERDVPHGVVALNSTTPNGMHGVVALNSTTPNGLSPNVVALNSTEVVSFGALRSHRSVVGVVALNNRTGMFSSVVVALSNPFGVSS
jgi:hypothetical protein